MRDVFRIDAHDGEGQPRSVYVLESTYNKVQDKQKIGADIVINQSWKYKGQGYRKIEKLVQTNDRFSGKPKHIIWACYR